MKTNKFLKTKAPTKVPVKFKASSMKFDVCSEVKIYIPKKNGKPTLDKYWYVYTYFYNPTTNKRDYKFMIKGGINREKTLPKRKRLAKILKRALIDAINNGFTPFEKSNVKFDTININCMDALQMAFLNKKKSWSDRNLADAKSVLNNFKKFLIINDLKHLNITDINRRHVTAYLNEIIKKGKSNKTRNNHKAIISSIFTQLVNDDYLNVNICKEISNLKTEAKKNIPFTKEQLKKIKKEILKSDPYLMDYIYFIGYGFMRPITVNRIQLKDVNLQSKVIRIKTKTGEQTIYLINKLIEILKKYDVKNLDKNFYLFTPENKPAFWNTENNNKRSYFGKRFRKILKKLKFTNEYNLYSFRHTFILDLYNANLNKGLTQLQIKQKLMTITRHKSISGLDNYLRSIGAILPDDFEKDFSIDF